MIGAPVLDPSSGAGRVPAAPAADPPEAPLRVLVVDDDEVDRMIVRRNLARAGVAAELREAASAPDAIAQVAGGAFDCVFLDYNIPGGDGLTLLKGIRRAGLDVPVVMLTGQGDEQVAVELMKAGALDYLPKGAITPERLAQSLRYAVELSRAAAAARRAQEELRESAERTRFLSEASAALAGSLDVQSTLERAVRLAVPTIGDYALAYLVDESGNATGVASAHRDAEQERAVAIIAREHRPPPESTDSLLATVVRERKTRCVHGVTDDILVRNAGSPGVLAAFRALAPRSLVFAPLCARDRALGVLAFARVDGRPPFDEAAAGLAEEFAARAATSLDNARLYEEAQAARAEAEEANRAKSEFLARMSHDLRTPLNAIGGYAQLIELGVHGPVTGEQAAALVRIRRAQEHLLTLINDILSFAKLEAGQVRLEVRDVSLRRALADVASLVEPLARDKGLAFEWREAPEGPAVRADPERLQQVLTNLLGNAVKFTPAGGCVWLDWADAGREIRVVVRDTGVGIPADRLATIFDPFVQLGRTPANEGGGVGLGLAISRELTRAMGGRLEVESAVGAGSTFAVALAKAAAT